MPVITIARNGGRAPDELRPWKITCGVLDHAEGSALVEAGRTRVIAAASVEEKVPPFLRNRGKGRITAQLRKRNNDETATVRPDEGIHRKVRRRGKRFCPCCAEL